MNRSWYVSSLLLVPGVLAAQVEAPPGLAAVETERSRACVAVLNTVVALNQDLEPLFNRATRLQALDQAIALEDSMSVAPLDTADPVEAAVQAWFTDDEALGRQFAESQDSSLVTRRREARDAVRQRLRDALATVSQEGQERVAATGDLDRQAAPCEGAILVRPVVLEVCDTLDGPICDAAADSASTLVRFVDAAVDIWDLEELRPWGEPERLAVTPEGGLGGGRTSVRARQGNIIVVVAVLPMIRERAGVSAEEAADFDANLDSLGFVFDHPDFIMAPAIEVRLSVTSPIGGETHYMLHFGDLSDPPNQVLWTVPTGSGPRQTVIPAGPGALARLQQGQTLSLTAVAVGEDTGSGAEAEAVYSIPLTGVNQTAAVGAVLGYMGGGQLAQDLLRLVPPGAGGG